MQMTEFIGFFKDYRNSLYWGYPMKRRVICQAEYDEWVSNGRPSGLVKEVFGHPIYLKGRAAMQAVVDDGTRDFSDVEFAESYAGSYLRDGNGRPVFPYAEALCLSGMALEGPGVYWNYGPNLCADAVVLGEDDAGRLKIAIIMRRDTSEFALPGGYIRKGEDPQKAAARVLAEGTGMNLLVEDLQLVECVYRGIVLDARITLNAWPETSAFAFILKPGAIDRYDTHDDEEEPAFISVAGEQLIAAIYSGHRAIARKAIRLYEDTTGTIVGEDGVIIK